MADRIAGAIVKIWESIVINGLIPSDLPQDVGVAACGEPPLWLLMMKVTYDQTTAYETDPGQKLARLCTGQRIG